MARPHKPGIDYFPMDWDFDQDDKIALVEAELDEKGTLRIIKLWAAIYHDQGYYKAWGDDEARLFAKRKGIPFDEVKVLVETCLKRGVFDRGLFDRFHILTSAGVQKRYLHACENRARIALVDRWFLLSAEEVADLPEKIKKRLVLTSAEITQQEMPKPERNTEKTPGFTGIKHTKEKIKKTQQQTEQSFLGDNLVKSGTSVDGAAVAAELKKAGVDCANGKLQEICDRLIAAEVDPGFVAFASDKAARTPGISNPAGFMLTQLLTADSWIQAYKTKRRKERKAKCEVPPPKCPNCGGDHFARFLDRPGAVTCRTCRTEWVKSGDSWIKSDESPSGVPIDSS